MKRMRILFDMIEKRHEYFSKRNQELRDAYKLKRAQLRSGLRSLRTEELVFLRILR
jgi:hypothetical protein